MIKAKDLIDEDIKECYPSRDIQPVFQIIRELKKLNEKPVKKKAKKDE